jgi:hypothetical protein
LDHGTIAVQPAGPAGQRHVFLTISFGDTARQLELVLSERTAHRLGEALKAGSIGLPQEFHLSVDGCE